MGDHTRNYCAAIYFFLVTYIFFLHEPRVIDPALSSDGDKVGWCLTKRGRTRGCINKEKLGSNTRKNTIQKNCHTKNVRVFSHTKNTIQKNTIQKIAIQKIAIHFFPYKKLLCSAHTKKLPYIFYYVFFSIQKITMYYTQKKSHTKKITSIFYHTKNYYVFSHTKNYHTKKMLVFFLHTQKNIM